MLSGASLAEEGVERIIAAAYGFIGRHLSIRLNAMLEAKQLPASIADLDASLADVDAESLTHLSDDTKTLEALLARGGPVKGNATSRA